MQKITFPNSNNATITMSAVLNFPKGFDENRKYPTVVVSHAGSIRVASSIATGREAGEIEFLQPAARTRYEVSVDDITLVR